MRAPDRDPKYATLAEIYEGQLDVVLDAWKQVHARELTLESPNTGVSRASLP